MSKREPYFQPDFSMYQSSTFYEELNLGNNDKQLEKFIKTVERIIRTSLEYRNYIRYLKQEVLLIKCNILNRLPEEVSKEITIEMHHYPFTLYDLVEIVTTKHVKLGNKFTRLSIANEVMNLHYAGHVGLVPLSKTMHQLAHSDPDILHRHSIYGKYETFITDYEMFFTQFHTDKIANFYKRTMDSVAHKVKSYLSIDDNLLQPICHSDYLKVELKEVETEEESVSNPIQ